MKTKLFGQFLLEKGYVTREQLLHALAEQRESAGTLGDLAIATGVLTVQDVDTIYRYQHQENQSFTQAAVSLGLLTEKQLADLLHPQSAERLLLGQILMAFGYLDRATLDEALIAHHSEPAEDDSSLMRHFKHSDLSGVGPLAISVLRSVFKESVGAPVSLQPVPAIKAVSAGQAIWSQIISRGSDDFMLAVQISEEEACAVGGAALGMPIEDFDELARDAMGEFLNVVTGHVCSNLHDVQGGVSAAPPEYHAPEAFLSVARPGISLLCTSDQIQFTYIVARPVRAQKPAVGLWAVTGTEQPSARARQRAG